MKKKTKEKMQEIITDYKNGNLESKVKEMAPQEIGDAINLIPKMVSEKIKGLEEKREELGKIKLERSKQITSEFLESIIKKCQNSSEEIIKILKKQQEKNKEKRRMIEGIPA